MNAPRLPDASLLRRRPVLVTGGAGFIGSHVVSHLVQRGWDVRVLDLPGTEVSHLPRQACTIAADIRDGTELKHAMQDCGTVLHLAANAELWSRDPSVFEGINHLGTRQVLEAARQMNVSRIVHVSTELILDGHTHHRLLEPGAIASADRMIGPYCRSKRRAELAVREYLQRGMSISVVSPGVPVGEGDYRRGTLTRLIGQFLDRRLKAYLDNTFALIDVRDAAAAIVAAAVRGERGRRYVAVAEHWPFQRLLDNLSRFTGIPAPRWRIPYPAALAFAWLEEIYCRRFSACTPMASVAGVRPTRRNVHPSGIRHLHELNVAISSCRSALHRGVRWLQNERTAAARRTVTRPGWRPRPVRQNP